jgi:hypothetical protein
MVERIAVEPFRLLCSCLADIFLAFLGVNLRDVDVETAEMAPQVWQPTEFFGSD